MKKVLLIALATLSFGIVATAQKFEKKNNLKFYSANDPAGPFSRQSLNKGGTMVSDWYSTLELISKSNVGSSLTSYVDFIYHDSLGKYLASDGMQYGNDMISFGQIFDPKDDLQDYLPGSKPANKLSRFNSYKIDSIAFAYLYVRNVDSIPDGMGGKKNVVDTLFIAYHAGAQINRNWQITSNQNRFGMVDWNWAKRLPANFVKMDTFLLSSGVNEALDTTRATSASSGGFENSYTTKIAQFPAPAGMSITANPDGSTVNNLTGFSVVFKSGVQTVIGTDTAVMVNQRDPATTPGIRRTNYFGYRYQTNTGAIEIDNKYFLNTSLYGVSRYAYANVGNPGGYLPGIIFNNERFTQTYFHLTITGNIGAGVENNDQISLNRIYPNPTTGMITANFETKTNADVTVDVVNLIGQTVKTFNFGKNNAGVYELPMDLSSLNPGVYMINLKSGNSSRTEKIVITE